MATLTHEEISRLAPEERLALIADLWDSLEDADVPLSAAQRAELMRRIESFDQDRACGITWAQLKAQLAKRSG